MRKILFAVFIFISFESLAQDPSIKKLQDESSKTIKKDPEDTIPQIWRKGGLYSLNVAQGSLSNWAAGGDNFSFAIASYLSLYAFYKEGRRSWDNTLDFNFGFVNTTSLGSRKNDDRLDILSKYGYAISKKLNLAGLFNFRSQIAKGYNYSNDVRVFSSNFLAPAYVLVSPGIDWKPDPYLSVFLSPATSRWVIVRDDSLSAKGLYGVDPFEHDAFEIGAFLTVNYLRDFTKSITYKARLDLFSNYRHNPENVDLFMTNILAFKASKVLNASLNLDFIYDDDVRIFGKNKQTPALQVKSLIGLGLQLKF